MSTIPLYIFLFLSYSPRWILIFFVCHVRYSLVCLLESQSEWPRSHGTSLKAQSTPSGIILLAASRAHATETSGPRLYTFRAQTESERLHLSGLNGLH